MLLKTIRSTKIPLFGSLLFSFDSLFGRANQLSLGNSNREPNDHNLLRSLILYQKSSKIQYKNINFLYKCQVCNYSKYLNNMHYFCILCSIFRCLQLVQNLHELKSHFLLYSIMPFQIPDFFSFFVLLLAYKR
jgi:hypothetical protein